MSRAEDMRLLSIGEAAEILGYKKESLYDRRVLDRLKLPCVKIGGKVLFLESDLKAMIKRGTEKR